MSLWRSSGKGVDGFDKPLAPTVSRLLTAAIAKDSDRHMEMIKNRIKALITEGKYKEALADINRILEIETEDYNAIWYVWRMYIKMLLSPPQDPTADGKAAMQGDLTQTLTYVCLFIWHFNTGNYAEAKNVGETAASEVTETKVIIHFYYLLALLSAQQGKYDNSYLNKASEIVRNAAKDKAKAKENKETRFLTPFRDLEQRVKSKNTGDVGNEIKQTLSAIVRDAKCDLDPTHLLKLDVGKDEKSTQQVAFSSALAASGSSSSSSTAGGSTASEPPSARALPANVK